MRVLKNDQTAEYEQNPSLIQPFPQQLITSLSNGTFHLGGDETTTGVDPAREGYPAGQASGAINSVVSAGSIVASMMAEAEAAIARIAKL